MKKTTIRKYARLIARVGAGIKKGQPVVITAEVDQHEFITYLVDECYKAGAKSVRVDWSFQPITKLHYRHQSVKTLSTVPKWAEEKQKDMHMILKQPLG